MNISIYEHFNIRTFQYMNISIYEHFNIWNFVSFTVVADFINIMTTTFDFNFD